MNTLSISCSHCMCYRLHNMSILSTFEINLIYKPHALLVNSLPDFVSPFLFAVAFALDLACLLHIVLYGLQRLVQSFLFSLLKLLESKENRCYQVDFGMLVVGWLRYFCGCV
jgi:hypothetical protein